MPRPRWRPAAVVVALCAVAAGALAWDMAEAPSALTPPPSSAAAPEWPELDRAELGAPPERLPVAGQDLTPSGELGEALDPGDPAATAEPSVAIFGDDPKLAEPAPAGPPRPAADAGAPPPEPDEAAEPQVELPPMACGLITCGSGDVCCNPSCGICVPDGDTCDPTPCEARVRLPVSMMCGQNTCSVGEVCCNPSCGTCATEGAACDATPCTPRITVPVSMRCGQNTCSVGEVCCNPSCGTCAEEGESCDTTPCTPRIRYPL